MKGQNILTQKGGIPDEPYYLAAGDVFPWHCSDGSMWLVCDSL
jgi:hypothetical protein